MSLLLSNENARNIGWTRDDEFLLVRSWIWSVRVRAIQTNEPTPPEFDRYAHSYAELLEDPIRTRFANDPLHFHRRKSLLIEGLLKRTGVVSAKQRWLDVGCGRGELLNISGRNFARAIGCDLSAGMLCSNDSIEVHKQPSPVELPFDDSSVDFVTAVCVYHHVQDRDRPLLTREIRRVLTPGGICCIIEHNPWNPVTKAIVRRCPVDVDAKLLTAKMASRLLQTATFEHISTDYFLYFPERFFDRLNSIERKLAKIPFGGQYALVARAPLR